MSISFIIKVKTCELIKWSYEPYGGTLVSQMKRSLVDDWFCGCKWSKIEINSEHQSVYKTSR